MAGLLREAVAKLPRDDAKRYFTDWRNDLAARMKMIDLAEEVYEDPEQQDKSGVASLLHAADYLKDRIRYEMAPHPKGMIKVTGEFSA